MSAKTEILKNILRGSGGDAGALPDNLLSTHYEKIIEAFGGRVDDLPDRLETTYLKRIAECAANVSNGGGSGVTIKNQNKTFTENGTYRADSGYTGLGTVTVAVPTTELQEKSVTITQNGTVEVTPDNGKALSKASVIVAVPEKVPTLQEKTATENGEVVADSGYDGLSKVTVNVQASGGGSGTNKLVQVADRSVTEITAEDLNGATSIGHYAFYGCEKLTSLVIPTSVKSFGVNAFESCTALETVTIPPSVTSINYNCFRYCSELKTVYFSSSVNGITANAFDGCKKMEVFDFSNHTQIPSLFNRNAFSSVRDTCKIIVPDALYDTWISSTNWASLTLTFVKASEV